MPFCHFSRVFDGTTWSDLKVNTKLQTSNKCKKLEYVELVLVAVEQYEFDIMCNDLSKSRDCYQKYADKSVAGLDGKWKCIVIENIQSKKKIIIYTAGRKYPLYAAISE